MGQAGDICINVLETVLTANRKPRCFRVNSGVQPFILETAGGIADSINILYNSCMSTLMNNLITRLKQKPPEKQEALASQFLSEMDDEEKWDKAFADTTDKQWQAMVDRAQKSVEENGAISSEEFYSRTGETGS